MDEESTFAELHRTVELLSTLVRAGAPAGGSNNMSGEAPLTPARGPRQQAILDITGMHDEAGMKPADIAAEIGYLVPNTYVALHTMARTGLVELIANSHPQRWRLARPHRHTAGQFRHLAGLVLCGEWTTCADISIACRGDTSAAWMVCWAVRRLPDIPNPHRILLQGGVVHPYGHEHQRSNPEQNLRALAQEGVRFSATGAADPGSRVSWDLLRQRSRGSEQRPLASEPVRLPPGPQR